MTSDKLILNILKELLSTYKILFDILHREREYLIKIESEKVEEISKEKDTVIMKLRLLEEERRRLVSKYLEENNIEGELHFSVFPNPAKDHIFIKIQNDYLSTQGVLITD